VNLEALKDRLIEREAQLTEIRWGVPYGYLKTIKMLTKVGKILALVEVRLQKMGAQIPSHIQKQIDIGYKNWSLGRRFMSLDVERTREGELQEIGITMIQGRRIESFNYQIREVNRGPQFIFGRTIKAEFTIIKNLISLHGQGADYYIGNDFRHDIEHLRAEEIPLPDRFYYDTSNWGKAILGYRPRLIDLAQSYNVGSTQMHCGGNDARYTAEIFLKMINTHRSSR
jgi:hypothetical protein